MSRQRSIHVLACALVVALLAACGAGATPATVVGEPAVSGAVTASTAGQAVAVADPTSIAAASAENNTVEDSADDISWDDSDVIRIDLRGDSIVADGDGVVVDGSTATITGAGSYELSGALADGQIVVDTEDAAVRLILSGVDLHSSTGAPISIVSAEQTLILLADNTENVVADGSSYVFANAEEDEPNAAIFSAGDLTIAGNGSLTVAGNYNDGIASKDGLVIAGGAISVSAVDDGIRGKDYLVVKGGSLTVDAQGDGLKSDNEEDATMGFVAIEAGVLDVTAGGDAIQATTDVLITDGDLALAAGGGSAAALEESASAKGIKAAALVIVDGGRFAINAADDAIHSNASITVNGGTFSIASGDDGMHADASLTINGGDIEISESYEGIESAVVTIGAGDITIVSSDDGLNVAGGADGSGLSRGPSGRPSADAFAASGSYLLSINGGRIVIDAGGDGVDSNGSIEMTDGTVIVNGPTESMNGALDSDGPFTVSGGLLVAAGSAGMAEAPGATSTQRSVLVNLESTLPAGTLVEIRTSDGDAVLTFAPTKAFQSIAFSSPELADGATYEVFVGGSAAGAEQDGLYQDAADAPGTRYASFTMSGVVTTIGSTGGRFR